MEKSHEAFIVIATEERRERDGRDTEREKDDEKDLNWRENSNIWGRKGQIEED